MSEATYARERSGPLTEQALPSLAFGTLILVVATTQAAFALWMNARGYLWGDAQSRAASGLIAIYGSDPHLAAIGFVWMPLPTLLELFPIALYPAWPSVVSSGFAASCVTVLAGSLTAAIVYGTSRRFGLSEWLSAAYSLLVSFCPMLFLFSTNGMSEGLAAPFLIGSVCCLLAFWHEGYRRYIAFSGVFLALGFACVYQTAYFAAALLLALVVGIFSSENEPSYPQGRRRAVEGLSILLLVPCVYFAVLWVIANAAIMNDPLYFATSSYSNEGYIAATGVSRIADEVIGDPLGALRFVVVRTLPFCIPLAPVLLIRLSEGRLFKANTATLLLLALVVPFGLILPQLYQGQSFGWLRYFMYPLFVAAGWGIYEIALSKRPNFAAALILAGWSLTIPASLWVMSDPNLGQNEHLIVRNLFSGKPASATGYPLYFEDVTSVSRAIDMLGPDELVLADASNAWTVAATASRDSLGHRLVLTADERFKAALKDPREYGIGYLLVPNPGSAPQDLLNAAYPGLWEGNAPGFTLEQDFSETGQHWRLYRVDAAR